MQIDTFKMWFIGKNNITKVDKSWNGELVDELSELKQENRYDVIRRYLTRMSLDGIIQAESIKLDDVSKAIVSIYFKISFSAILFSTRNFEIQM